MLQQIHDFNTFTINEIPKLDDVLYVHTMLYTTYTMMMLLLLSQQRRGKKRLKIDWFFNRFEDFELIRNIELYKQKKAPISAKKHIERTSEVSYLFADQREGSIVATHSHDWRFQWQETFLSDGWADLGSKSRSFLHHQHRYHQQWSLFTVKSRWCCLPVPRGWQSVCQSCWPS